MRAESMINVLHLIDHYRIGGPGKTIINTAKYIDRDLFTLHVACFLPEGCETELSTEIKKNKIAFLSLQDVRGISLYNIRTLIKYIDMYDISIYHGHGYKADIYGILLCALRRKMIILTTHHGWIRNTYAQVILGWVTIKLSFLFEHTIIVSEEMQRYLSKYTLKKGSFTTIHNAIRMEDYKAQGIRDEQRKLINADEDDIVLLSVGRLSDEKGCINLLNAFLRVYHKNQKIKLLYVGDGPLMSTLMKKMKKFNLTKSVILCGYHRLVQPYYEAADIFICPSDTEGLSNVILEAMAYSLPVIATNVGGNAEIIDHKINGLLVPPKNETALANTITQLTENSELRKILSRSGYETVKNKFAFDKRTKRIENLYLRLYEKSHHSLKGHS